MIVCVLADTHLSGQVASRLPGPVLRALQQADLVLHAGDLVTRDAYQELSALGPLRAVLGNNDRELAGVLPQTLELELAGVRVAMVHDSGPRRGREARLRRRFPGADLVVFGHSHLPLDEPGLKGQRLFNPGSPTYRRQAPRPSFGRLVLEGRRLLEHRLIEL